MTDADREDELYPKNYKICTVCGGGGWLYSNIYDCSGRECIRCHGTGEELEKPEDGR